MEIKLSNLITLSVASSSMSRVFQKGSQKTIEAKICSLLPQLKSIKTKSDFNKIHHEFCLWFISSISTAEKKLKSGTLIPSQATC